MCTHTPCTTRLRQGSGCRFTHLIGGFATLLGFFKISVTRGAKQIQSSYDADNSKGYTSKGQQALHSTILDVPSKSP